MSKVDLDDGVASSLSVAMFDEHSPAPVRVWHEWTFRDLN